MAKNNFTPKLERALGQIRFRPTLAAINGGSTILEDLESKFEEWQAEGTTINLFSPSKKEFLQTTPSTITAGKETETQQRKVLVEYVETVLSNSISSFNLKKVTGIGFRTTMILGTDFTYKELSDLIYKKFYSNHEILESISSQDCIDDVVFVLKGSMNGYHNKVHIGPTTASEAMQNFKPQFSTNSKLSDTNLFIDIDVVLEDVNMDDVTSLFEGAADENNRILNAYLEYLNKEL